VQEVGEVLCEDAQDLRGGDAGGVVPARRVSISSKEMKEAHITAHTLPSFSAASRTLLPTSSRNRLVPPYLSSRFPASSGSTCPTNRCRNAPSTPCSAIHRKCLFTVRASRLLNTRAGAPSLCASPGTGYSSAGSYAEVSGQRSVLGRPLAGAVSGWSIQCSQPWCPARRYCWRDRYLTCVLRTFANGRPVAGAGEPALVSDHKLVLYRPRIRPASVESL
jgi:hypothetical protein